MDKFTISNILILGIITGTTVSCNLMLSTSKRFALVGESVNFTCLGKPGNKTFTVYVRAKGSDDFVLCSDQNCAFESDNETCRSLNENRDRCRHDNGTLMFSIKHITERDFTDYACEQDGLTSNSTLQEFVKPGQATVNTSTDVINVNDRLQLYCWFNSSQEGNPNIYQYIFILNDKDIIGNWSDENNVSYTITSINQEGEYSCNGRNKLNGTDYQEGLVSQPKRVDVFVPPEFTQPGEQTNYSARYNDQQFTMHCAAIGKPLSAITFYKAGKQVPEENFTVEIYHQEIDGPYGIKSETRANITWNVENVGSDCMSVTYYDSNDYSCVATNNGTKNNQTHSHPISIKTKYPPLWNRSSFDFYAAFNTTVSLVCDVCAYPAADFVWITTEGIIEDQVLTIDSILDDHFGPYTCNATNEMGTSSFVIYLKEDGPPRIENVAISDRTSMSISLTWNLVLDGGHPPVYFLVHYKLKAEQSYTLWSNNTSSGDLQFSENITNLIANSSYDIQLEAINQRSSHNRMSSNCSETTLEQPNIILQSAELQGKELTVKWSYNQPSYIAIAAAFDYFVTVEIRYWHVEDSEQKKKECPASQEPVSAKQEQVECNDDALNQRYVVEMLVYENAILNQLISNQQMLVNDMTFSMSAGGIIGIIVLTVTVCLLCLLGIKLIKDRGGCDNHYETTQRGENECDANHDYTELNNGAGGDTKINAVQISKETHQPDGDAGLYQNVQQTKSDDSHIEDSQDLTERNDMYENVDRLAKPASPPSRLRSYVNVVNIVNEVNVTIKGMNLGSEHSE